MRKFILPLAAGFVLGVSGAAMAGSLKADNDIVAAKATGPQLLTNSQMDKVVAGDVTTGATLDGQLTTSGAGTIFCVPSGTGVASGFSGGSAGASGGTAGSGYTATATDCSL